MLMRILALAATLGLAAVTATPAPASEFTGHFILDTQDGKRVNDESFNGKVRMMTFGYTFCPDICPTTLSTMAAALDLLGAKAGDVVPIFVTVDPKRDTKEQMKEYLSAFGPSFVGLTGTQQMTDAAAKAFRVRYAVQVPDDAKTDYYLVDHTAGIYILDRTGHLVIKMGHLSTAEEVAERLTQVIDGVAQ